MLVLFKMNKAVINIMYFGHKYKRFLVDFCFCVHVFDSDGFRWA